MSAINRSYLSYASYLSLLIFGLFNTTLGAALPNIRESLGLSISETGTLLASRSVGYIVAVLASGFLADTLGKKAIAVLSSALFSSSLLAFGVVPGLWINSFFSIILGLGTGGIEVICNALIIDLYGDRKSNAMNTLHLFFPLGAIIGPLYTAFLFSRSINWRFAFITYGFLSLALLGAFSIFRFPGRAVEAKGAKDSPLFLLKERLVLILGLLLGLYVSVQIGVGTWMTTYLRDLVSLPPVASANILALYWTGMTLGRFVGSRISHKVKHTDLILVMCVGSAAFLILSLVATSPAMVVAFFFITGFSLSAIYPMVVVVGGSSYPLNSAAVVGIISAGSSLSSSLLQWTMAQISQATTIKAGMFFYAILAVGMIVLTLIASREANRVGYKDV